MKAVTILGNRSIGLILLALLVLSGTAVTIFTFTQLGPIPGAAVGILGVIGILLTRAILELIRDLSTDRQRCEQRRISVDRQIVSLLEDVEASEAELHRQAPMLEQLLERVRAVEHSVGQLAQVDEKVLGRVRAVEHSVGQLAQVDEKVLGRVRAVEHSVGQLAQVDEKVLGRVRAVEHSVGQLALGDEKVLERVRAVEHSVGDLRRISRELLEEVWSFRSEPHGQDSSVGSESGRRNHEIGHHRELHLSEMMRRLADHLAES